jgi:hypothetical protein
VVYPQPLNRIVMSFAAVRTDHGRVPSNEVDAKAFGQNADCTLSHGWSRANKIHAPLATRRRPHQRREKVRSRHSLRQRLTKQTSQPDEWHAVRQCQIGVGICTPERLISFSNDHVIDIWRKNNASATGRYQRVNRRERLHQGQRVDRNVTDTNPVGT